MSRRFVKMPWRLNAEREKTLSAKKSYRRSVRPSITMFAKMRKRKFARQFIQSSARLVTNQAMAPMPINVRGFPRRFVNTRPGKFVRRCPSTSVRTRR